MATTPKGIYYPNDYNEIADIPKDMKKMAESIDEVFENTDSDLSDIKAEQTTQNNRLNNLETDNTTNKDNISANTQEINNIKSEQTTQNTNISTNATNIESLQEENDNLKKIVSQLPQVTGQGTSITLENTIEAQFTIFDVEGNSVQDGSPSPDNEVPIYSAGDNGSINEKINNKNWFNKNGNFKTYNATVTPIDTGIKVENNDGGTYRSVWCKIGKDELLGKTLTIQTSISTYNGAIPRIMVVFNNETAQYIENIKTITDTTEGTLVNIPNSFPENADRVSLIFYCSFTSATPKGSYVEYKDFQVELGTTATPYVEHEEQDHSIFVQQPMRSIGDVRDCFVKKSDGWYERHYIKYLELLISAMNNSENYPGWTNVQQIKNDFPNINTQLITKTSFLCNIFEKTSRIMVINTVGNNSILYLDKSLLNLTQTQWKENYPDLILKLAYISPLPLDLPCTEEQIEQLENKPSTYKDFTIIQSKDETPAYLEVSGIYDLNKLITRTEVLESEV